MRASSALRGYNTLEAPFASSEPIPGSTGIRRKPDRCRLLVSATRSLKTREKEGPLFRGSWCGQRLQCLALASRSGA